MPQRRHNLLTFLCFALILGIASCETFTCSYYSSYCNNYISWYASGLESRQDTVTINGYSQASFYYYISSAAQYFTFTTTSYPSYTNVQLEVDVDSSTVIGTTYGNNLYGYVNVPLYSYNMVFYFENPNPYSITITLNLEIESFSYSNYYSAISTAVTAVGIIVIVVPIVIGLAVVSGIVCCIVRRNRMMGRRTAGTINPVISSYPIKTSEHPANQLDPIVSPQPVFVQPEQMLYSQQQYYYPQDQNMQGYTQQYPQGFDQTQAAYYTQPQGVYYVQQQPQAQGFGMGY